MISPTLLCTLSITVSTSFKDSCVLLARLPTSVATTANPLPASPALAASMEAFNASRFVDEEISLIRFKVIPISFTASDSLEATSMVVTMDSDTSLLIVCNPFNSSSLSLDLLSKSLAFTSTFSTLSATTVSHSLNSVRFSILSLVLELSTLLLTTSCSLVAASSSAEALSFSEICERAVPAAYILSDNTCTDSKTFSISFPFSSTMPNSAVAR